MSITDELRKWLKSLYTPNSATVKDEGERIADRIDAALAERYMELPLDADGVPIRIGDVLTDDEYEFKVFELAAFCDGSWSIRNEYGDAWEACDVTHHHEPTFEDVLRDMLDSLDLDPTSHVDTGAVVAEYAAKLRLAGDGE